MRLFNILILVFLKEIFRRRKISPFDEKFYDSFLQNSSWLFCKVNFRHKKNYFIFIFFNILIYYFFIYF